MDSSVLTGSNPAKAFKVRRLTKKSAEKKARKRGLKTNRAQKDGRKQRHDHPPKPHEQKV